MSPRLRAGSTSPPPPPGIPGPPGPPGGGGGGGGGGVKPPELSIRFPLSRLDRPNRNAPSPSMGEEARPVDQATSDPGGRSVVLTSAGGRRYSPPPPRTCVRPNS